MTNSLFEKNRGKEGGALYFDRNKFHNIKKYINEINFDNIIFKENFASYHGGAIYSKNDEIYSLKSSSVTFDRNKANIAGGAIFLSKLNIDAQNKFQDGFEFNNNKATSHGENIGTSPSLIKLEYSNNNTLSESNFQKYSIITGSYLPLKFSLYDSFNNLVVDPDNFYSDIIIHILFYNNTIKTNDDDDDTIDNIDINKKYKIIGNVGSFSKGNVQYHYKFIH